MSTPKQEGQVPTGRGVRKRSEGKGPASDEVLAKALGHPIRASALRILNERVAGAIMIAQELRKPLGLVAYHVRVLEGYGLLELVEERAKRGATEFRYRATTRAFLSDETWGKLEAVQKHGISVAGLQMVTDAATMAMMEGLFDSHANRHLSCTPVTVDERGFDDAMSLLNETLDQILSIQGESASRLAEGDQESVRATISLMGFESPQP